MVKKLLVADDHPLVRRSIRSICRVASLDEPDEVPSCRELWRSLNKVPYTHLILDLTLADGSTATLVPDIFEKFPRLKILIYSSQSELLHAKSFRRFGIHYVSKQHSEQDTIERMVAFLNDVSTEDRLVNAKAANPFLQLAPREKDVLPYLLEGRSQAEIAETLDVSASSVRTWKERILEKTDTKSVEELLTLASLYGIRW